MQPARATVPSHPHPILEALSFSHDACRKLQTGLALALAKHDASREIPWSLDPLTCACPNLCD